MILLETDSKIGIFFLKILSFFLTLPSKIFKRDVKINMTMHSFNNRGENVATFQHPLYYFLKDHEDLKKDKKGNYFLSFPYQGKYTSYNLYEIFMSNYNLIDRLNELLNSNNENDLVKYLKEINPGHNPKMTILLHQDKKKGNMHGQVINLIKTKQGFKIDN